MILCVYLFVQTRAAQNVALRTIVRRTDQGDTLNPQPSTEPQSGITDRNATATTAVKPPLDKVRKLIDVTTYMQAHIHTHPRCLLSHR